MGHGLKGRRSFIRFLHVVGRRVRERKNAMHPYLAAELKDGALGDLTIEA